MPTTNNLGHVHTDDLHHVGVSPYGCPLNILYVIHVEGPTLQVGQKYISNRGGRSASVWKLARRLKIETMES